MAVICFNTQQVGQLVSLLLVIRHRSWFSSRNIAIARVDQEVIEMNRGFEKPRDCESTYRRLCSSTSTPGLAYLGRL